MKNTARGMALPCLIICLMLLQSQRILAENYQIPVKIGEKIPNITLKNFMNEPGKEVLFSDLKGKVVIIDFFATWCPSCVAYLPHMNDLKQKFGDKLQILVVTKESEETIIKYSEKYGNIKNNSIPILCNDSVLSKLFPHLSIPHEVWIDTKGVVRGISDAKFVTADNIENLIVNNQLAIPVKNDFFDFDHTQTLSYNLANPKNRPQFLYRSTFTSHYPGVVSLTGSKADSISKTIYFVNNTILSLYSSFIEKDLWAGRVEIEVKDTTRFVAPAELVKINKDWDESNTFCYELTTPASLDRKKIQRLMKGDLDRNFDLTTTIVEKIKKCWVVKISDQRLFNRTILKKEITLGKPKAILIENAPMDKLIKRLNSSDFVNINAPIFIDQTGYNGKIFIEIPVSLLPENNSETNIEPLKKILEQKGLTLVAAKVPLKVFVFRDAQ